MAESNLSEDAIIGRMEVFSVYSLCASQVMFILSLIAGLQSQLGLRNDLN